METLELFYRGGVALFIGLLIGIQREHAHEEQPGKLMFGGARTFSLLALVGYLASLVSTIFEAPALFVSVLVMAGILIGIAYVFSALEGQVGMTTELAAVVTVMTGALCALAQLELAVAVGVATTAMLALKMQTQRFVRRLSRTDVYATIKFAIITAIVLPVLPNQTYGTPPLDVLNPYKVWLMVVFISGIGFLGYVLIKLVGAERGVGMAGILGGLASSTAVTLSFAQLSRESDGLGRAFAMAVLLSWTVMFGRVLVEVAVVNRSLLSAVWLPIAGSGAATLAYCGYLYYTARSEKREQPGQFSNPFELGPALTFGLLYGVILVVARAAQLAFGDAGLYASSLASGLADVDAITLSVAELSLDPARLSHATGMRAIMLAVLSNTLMKAGIVAFAGGPGLRRAVLPGLGLILATGLGLVFLVS